MADYFQTGRYLYLETPLGEHKLIVARFKCREAISQLFEIEIDCVAENATNIEFDRVIGQGINCGVLGEEDRSTPRHFHGICNAMSQGSRDKVFTDYTIRVVPEIWKLTQKFRSRMFQNMTIPDILRQVLAGFNVTYELPGTWEPRVYTLQYHETDYDFICRLMEEEGMFFFFKWAKGSHTMVLSNTPNSHPEIPGNSKLIYEGVGGGLRAEERISTWEKRQELRSGKWTLMDHNYQLPHRKLDAEKTVIDTMQVGKVQHKLKLAGNENLEIYDWPGEYSQRFDGIDKSGGERAGDLQKIFQDNKRTVGIRMQQSETPMLLITGASNTRTLTSGHKFTLSRHFNADGTYVLTSVVHHAHESVIRSGGGDEGVHYTNTFTCIPSSLPYRPPRVTRRPHIPGPQSAVVVGPPGEEIFTDKYGRIKVQFHWDRDGKNDADSSCWMRVATHWAGQEWGKISIPRIGQEVIVIFLGGDPDRPIVAGCVYNPDQMPRYELPDKKTVSYWASHSTPGGGRNNFNEVRMEDKKGKEQLFLHAERDMDTRVKQESRELIGANKHKTVAASEMESVGGDRHTTIGRDQVVKIGRDRREAVDGELAYKIGKNQQVKVSQKSALEAGTEIHIKAGQKVIIEAGAQVTLKGPGGFVDISALGVVIQGNLVLINSGGAAGSGSGSSPDTPDPAGPHAADDGTSFDKM